LQKFQIWHVGHYKEGLGGTVGEEREQVNADFSLYGNKTKHVTSSESKSRCYFQMKIEIKLILFLIIDDHIDELSQAVLYMNNNERKWPDFLVSRMKKVMPLYVKIYYIICVTQLRHFLIYRL